MRTVCLSNPVVQEKIARSFIPLKVQIDYGSPEFPLSWPALKSWKTTYALMGGSKSKGITGCCVISPDLDYQLGSTGSAFVWEMFESIAYNPEKFGAMLDRSLERYGREKLISEDVSLKPWQKRVKLHVHKAQVSREVAQEGKFHLPPKGFKIADAVELFRMSGDLEQSK